LENSTSSGRELVDGDVVFGIVRSSWESVVLLGRDSRRDERGVGVTTRRREESVRSGRDRSDRRRRRKKLTGLQLLLEDRWLGGGCRSCHDASSRRSCAQR